MKNTITKSGQRHNRAKLTDAQILEMFDAYDNGVETLKEIATRYGITAEHFTEILSGKTRTDNQVVNERRARIIWRSSRKKPAKFFPDYTPESGTLLTRAELGQRVFLKIKKDLESRGYSLWDENFDPDYPISLRAIWDIRKGHFRVSTLNSLPGIKVQEWFCIAPE